MNFFYEDKDCFVLFDNVSHIYEDSIYLKNHICFSLMPEQLKDFKAQYRAWIAAKNSFNYPYNYPITYTTPNPLNPGEVYCHHQSYPDFPQV